MKIELIRCSLSKKNIAKQSENLTPTSDILITTPKRNELQVVSRSSLKLEFRFLIYLVSNNKSFTIG
jgi:hypothetical protein